MNIRLPYGLETSPVDVPDNWINGRCYRTHRFEEAADPRTVLRHALENPDGGQPFNEIVQNRSNAIIVVDSRFPQMFDDIVPGLLEHIHEHSELEPGDVSILLTNSFWNPMDPTEAPKIVPESILARYDVVMHEPTEEALCQEHGTIGEGVPFRVNTLYEEADLKIIVGPVQPDLTLGYVGGRSLIMPGLTHRSTAEQVYSYKNVAKPTVNYASLRNNPLHRAGLEAQESAGCHFNISPILTLDRKVSEVYAGEPGQSFMRAASRVKEQINVRLKEPMDIAVTCGGGAPWDTTIENVVNAIAAAVPVLKDGGTIVVAAGLADGFGPDPLRDIILGSNGPRGFTREFGREDHFLPGQWIAQRYYQLLMHHEVLIQTDGLTEDEVWEAGMTPIPNLQEAIEVAMMDHGQRCKICALPDGPFSLATLQDGDHTTQYHE